MLISLVEEYLFVFGKLEKKVHGGLRGQVEHEGSNLEITFERQGRINVGIFVGGILFNLFFLSSSTAPFFCYSNLVLSKTLFINAYLLSNQKRMYFWGPLNSH